MTKSRDLTAMRRMLIDDQARKQLLKRQRALAAKAGLDTRPPRGRCTRCHANMARISPDDGYTDCGSCGWTNRPKRGHGQLGDLTRAQRTAGYVKPRAVNTLTDQEVQQRLEEAP